MLWPRHVSAMSRLQTLSGMSPPFVRLVSAVAAPPKLVWHVSAPVRFVRASKLCRACVRLPRPPALSACVRLMSALCPPCVCPPCVGFGHASKRRVSLLPSVRHASASCMFFLCPLVVPSLFVFIICSLSGFGRVYLVWLWPAFVSSASAVWFLCLCLFCVRCCLP